MLNILLKWDALLYWPRAQINNKNYFKNNVALLIVVDLGGEAATKQQHTQS